MEEETDFDSNVPAQPFLSCVTTGERFLYGEDTVGVVMVSFLALKTAAHTCTYRHAHTFTHTYTLASACRGGNTFGLFPGVPPQLQFCLVPMCVNGFSISREVNSAQECERKVVAPRTQV